MKKNKALLPTPEGTLIERIIHQVIGRFDEIIISVTEEKEFEFLPFKKVRDERPNQGPMMGIKSAISSSSHLKNFVIACDIPDVNISFLDSMIGEAEKHEIVIACSKNSRKEPLFGIYSKSVVPKMENLLNSGISSLIPLFQICQTKEVKISNGSWFKNLNTPREYEEFLRQMKREKNIK